MMPAAMTNRATVPGATTECARRGKTRRHAGECSLELQRGWLAAKAIVEVAAGGSGWAIAIPDHVAAPRTVCSSGRSKPLSILERSRETWTLMTLV